MNELENNYKTNDASMLPVLELEAKGRIIKGRAGAELR